MRIGFGPRTRRIASCPIPHITMKSMLVVGWVSHGLVSKAGFMISTGLTQKPLAGWNSVYGCDNVRVCYLLRVGDKHRKTVERVQH